MGHRPKIGLALGGGGARGLAHIPMLEAFDELNIAPSLVVGCSMGALVGAAYACGMSGKDLRKHAESLLNNRVDFAKYVFGARKAKPLELLSLKSIASLHLDGERLADLALPDHLPKNIEDAPIPLKIVATDYENMCEAVFSSGPLLRAVGASIAIPGIIAAPLIDGRIHVDGGVVNPVPFEHARVGNDLVVAVDVTGWPKPVGERSPSNLDLAIGSLLIMFHHVAELRRAKNPPDIYIEPAIDMFATGDFFRVKDIFAAVEEAKQELKEKLLAKLAPT